MRHPTYRHYLMAIALMIVFAAIFWFTVLRILQWYGWVQW